MGIIEEVLKNSPTSAERIQAVADNRSVSRKLKRALKVKTLDEVIQKIRENPGMERIVRKILNAEATKGEKNAKGRG